MIWTIARRQLLEYLITWRFGLVLAFSTVLVVLGTSLQVANLEGQVQEYEAQQNQAQQAMGEARTFNELRLGVGRRPPTLAFLCAGQDRAMPHFATMGILLPPLEALGILAAGEMWFIGYGSVQSREIFSNQNPLVQGLQRIDFTFVVATFLSLLAFLLSFDAVSGERETGTLPMVIANSVSRGTILLGKLVGGLVCLAISLAVALLAALLVGLQSSRIALSPADWVGVGLLAGASLLFLGGFLALGLAVSSQTARSSTSLVILLLVWTVAVTLVPSAAPYVASLVQDLPSQAEYARNQAATGQSLWKVLQSLAQSSPAPTWRMKPEFVDSDRLSGNIPYARAVRSAPREAVDWYIAGTEEGNRLIIGVMDQYWRIYEARFSLLLAQRHLAEGMGRFSPVFSFTNLAQEIAGTHPSAGVQYAHQARQFYDQFVDFARREGGLGLRFFTPLKQDDYLPLVDYERLFQTEGQERCNAIYEQKLKQAGPIQGLPSFRFRPDPPLAAALQLDLVLLALLPVLFFTWGFLRFVRREEGGRP